MDKVKAIFGHHHKEGEKTTETTGAVNPAAHSELNSGRNDPVKSYGPGADALGANNLTGGSNVMGSQSTHLNPEGPSTDAYTTTKPFAKDTHAGSSGGVSGLLGIQSQDSTSGVGTTSSSHPETSGLSRSTETHTTPGTTAGVSDPTGTTTSSSQPRTTDLANSTGAYGTSGATSGTSGPSDVYDERNTATSGLSSDGLRRGGDTTTDPTGLGSSSLGTKHEPSSSTTASTGLGESTTASTGLGGSSNQYSTTGTDSTTGTGLTGTALADRSVGSTTNTSTGTGGVGHIEPSFADSRANMGDSHPTFTGNRLDPKFHESTLTYHEEKLDDKTHHGGGWSDSATEPSTLPSTSTTSGLAGNTAPSSALQGGQGGPSNVVDTGPASKTLGPHSSNLANIVDPRVGPDPALQSSHAPPTTSQTSTHGGRDAAIGGAAGAVGGAGAYKAYEDHKDPTATTSGGTTSTHPTTTSEGHHHHLGRHDDRSKHESASTGHAAPHTLERHAERDEESRQQTKGGVLGFLHKDQHGKYDDPLEKDTTARDKFYGTDGVTHTLSSEDRGEHLTTGEGATSSSHTGRDAALAGGAAGTGGAALASSHSTSAAGPAYENTTVPSTSTGDSGPFGSGDGRGGVLSHVTDPTLAGQSSTHDTSAPYSSTGASSGTHDTTTSRTGRDTAVGTGAGAGVVGGTAAALSSNEPHHGTTGQSGLGSSGTAFKQDPTGSSSTYATDKGLLDSDYTTAPASGAGAFRKDPVGTDTVLAGGPSASDNYTKAGHGLSTDAPTTTDHTGEEKHRSVLDRLLHRDHPNKLHKDH